MFSRFGKYFLAAVVTIGAFAVSGSTAEAQSSRQRYWNNYWNWYDQTYRPYYQQRYQPWGWQQPRYQYYRGGQGYYGNPGYYQQPRFGTNVGPLYFEWR